MSFFLILLIEMSIYIFGAVFFPVFRFDFERLLSYSFNMQNSACGRTHKV